MAFVIGSPCIDTMDRTCIEVCPVDCVYEGRRKLYIQPDECIDSGACEVVCPVAAIANEEMLNHSETMYIDDSRSFFDEVLPGRSEPLGAPRGARDLGRIGVDTPLVSAHPRAS